MIGRVLKRIVGVFLTLFFCVGIIPIQAVESVFYEDTEYIPAEESAAEFPAEDAVIEELTEMTIYEEPAADIPAIEEPATEPGDIEPVIDEPATETDAVNNPESSDDTINEEGIDEPDFVEEGNFEEDNVEEDNEEIEENLLTSMIADPIEIAEYTNGNFFSGVYYRYVLDPLVNYTIVYNGEEYTGNREDIYEVVGEYPFVSTISQDENEWTVGNTYQATATLLGVSCDFDVTIVEDPSIIRTVTCGEPIKANADDPTLYKYYFIPEEDGFYRFYVISGHYDYAAIVNTGSEMPVAESSRVYLFQEGDDLKGYLYKGLKYVLKIRNNSGFEDCIMAIEKMPAVTGFSAVAQKRIVVGTNKSVAFYINEDTGEEIMWYLYTPEAFEPLYTVTYEGGIFIGDSDAVYNEFGHAVLLKTDETYENQWGIGTHTLTAEFDDYSYTFEVEIIEAPDSEEEPTTAENSTIPEVPCIEVYPTAGNWYVPRVYEVESVEDPLTYFSVTPVEIIEHTCGKWEMTDNGDEGTRFYLYTNLDYWHSNTGQYTLFYTVVYNGMTYTGDRNDIFRITGEYPDVDNTSMQRGNPWAAGTTYQATATLLGRSCQFDVTIIPSPWDTLTAEPVEIEEGTYCYDNNAAYPDPRSGKWYIYEPNKMPLTFTVTKGEETFTGTALELSRKYGYSFSLSGTVSEQRKAPWEAGHTYTVTCSFMGKETDIEIRILPLPSAGSTEGFVVE